MGLCSKRHFLLTICTLQLITTVERQVFDFLGFMWVPILINFFNIIFVILGFFGAFQYRPKYIISYCVWNALWFGWNVFLTCFYLSAGALDKNSDILNLGTGSFSWWQINGPGCKPYYNNTVPDRPDVYRPARPDRVTGCVLDYEVIEVLHSSTQCLLAIMAVVGGICLSRVFMEEDDSFDFVGGGDFGMAGHTPLHPMYVSYSALPPPGHHQHQHTMHSKHSTNGDNYFYYPTNTVTTTGSHRSGSSATLISPAPPMLGNHYGPPKKVQLTPNPNDIHMSERAKAILRNARNASYQCNDREAPTTATALTTMTTMTAAATATVTATATTIDYADYSNPVDQLRATSPASSRRADYDTLERHTPDLGGARPMRYYQRKTPPVTYSPLMGARNFNRSVGGTGSNSRQNRNSYRPRFHADHIREQQASPPPPPPPPRPPMVDGLRSFYSDPRLAVEETISNGQIGSGNNRDRARRRDVRPLSMFVNNY